MINVDPPQLGAAGGAAVPPVAVDTVPRVEPTHLRRGIRPIPQFLAIAGPRTHRLLNLRPGSCSIRRYNTNLVGRCTFPASPGAIFRQPDSQRLPDFVDPMSTGCRHKEFMSQAPAQASPADTTSKERKDRRTHPGKEIWHTVEHRWPKSRARMAAASELPRRIDDRGTCRGNQTEFPRLKIHACTT